MNKNNSLAVYHCFYIIKSTNTAFKTRFKITYIYFSINIRGNVIYATITYVIVFNCIVYFSYLIVYNAWIAITFYATKSYISMSRVKQKCFINLALF